MEDAGPNGLHPQSPYARLQAAVNMTQLGCTIAMITITTISTVGTSLA